MTNSLVHRVDIFGIDKNGSILVMTDWNEYPISWHYKLFLSFEENEKKLRQFLSSNPKAILLYTPRFSKYLENRKALYEEIAKKYGNIIRSIYESDFSDFVKKQLMQTIDLELNQLYPYEN